MGFWGEKMSLNELIYGYSVLFIILEVIITFIIMLKAHSEGKYPKFFASLFKFFKYCIYAAIILIIIYVSLIIATLLGWGVSGLISQGHSPLKSILIIAVFVLMIVTVVFTLLKPMFYN